MQKERLHKSPMRERTWKSWIEVCLLEHFAVRIPNPYLLEPLSRRKASSYVCMSVTFSIISWEGVEVSSLNGSWLEAHCHREKGLVEKRLASWNGFCGSGWYD